MAYEKQTFTSGQKLKAIHMNHIEEGLAAAHAAIEEMQTAGNEEELVAQQYEAKAGTYIQTKAYPATINNSDGTPKAAYVTHRYAVSEGVTYYIKGENVRYLAAGYPLAVFTTSTEWGEYKADGSANYANVIIDGTNGDKETNYNVNYTPTSDGYILIALHTSYVSYLQLYAYESSAAKETLKIQVFGDSMSDVHWGDGETWVSILKNYLPEYDLDIINSAIGGNTMTKFGTDPFKGVAWQMGLTEVTEGIGNSQGYNQFAPLATDRDLIIVWAGCNDWSGAEYSMDDDSIIKYHSSTFNTETGKEEVVEDSIDITKIHGAVRYVIETVSKKTTARLLLITPVQRYTPPEWDSKNQKWKGDAVQPKDGQGDVLRFDRTLIQYVDAIKKACAFYGVPCIDMYRESGLNRFNITNYTTDGVHANAEGDALFAAMIANKIKGML